MRLRPLRLGLLVVGLLAVVYGVLTWRGIKVELTRHEEPGISMTQVLWEESPSIYFVAAGLALVAFAAWPRRSKASPPSGT